MLEKLIDRMEKLLGNDPYSYRWPKIIGTVSGVLLVLCVAAFLSGNIYLTAFAIGFVIFPPMWIVMSVQEALSTREFRKLYPPS